MSDLLGIGSSAVAAYRTALSAIGDNVANSQTPGYTRRTVTLRETTPLNPSSIEYKESLEFGGVNAASVGRAWDDFRAADARITTSAASRADVRQTWLGNIETALDDGEAGVGQTLGTFFNAATSLTANPDDALGRKAVLMGLDDAAGAIRTTAASLARISDGITASARQEVSAFNSDLAALAKVNSALRQAPPGTPTSASLQDERDRLLDSISSRADINATFDSKGVVTVTLAQSKGTVLLDARGANSISVAVAQDGRLSYQFFGDGGVEPLTVTSGSLVGLSDSAAATADRRADLDSLAQDFADQVNAWSAQGQTADGNPGQPLLDASGGAIAIKTLTSDPGAIAAASDSDTPNGNLQALTALRDNNGAEARWAGIVSSSALMVNSAKSEATSTATARDNSLAARDEVSGVDLDQEAANLMRYQQAYNGATKIIQVARETMQTILDLF